VRWGQVSLGDVIDLGEGKAKRAELDARRTSLRGKDQWLDQEAQTSTRLTATRQR